MKTKRGVYLHFQFFKKKKWTFGQWRLHQLWQHNRGNYTTPNNLSKKKKQRKCKPELPNLSHLCHNPFMIQRETYLHYGFCWALQKKHQADPPKGKRHGVGGGGGAAKRLKQKLSESRFRLFRSLFIFFLLFFLCFPYSCTEYGPNVCTLGKDFSFVVYYTGHTTHTFFLIFSIHWDFFQWFMQERSFFFHFPPFSECPIE